MKPTILYILLPALSTALFYLIFLDHRPDYAGHYMAGFGGTLFMIMVGIEFQRNKEAPPATSSLILIILLACIAFGTMEEATTFRLAKFDEVDYCNQNLGAVLAALSSLIVLPDRPQESQVVFPSMIIGLLFLAGGFYYAFQ